MFKRALYLLTLAALVNLGYQYWPRSGGELIKVMDTYGKFGYIDLAGRIRAEPTWDSIREFDEQGMARVKKINSYGYVDRAGKVVVPAQYEVLGTFDEQDMAPAEKAGKAERSLRESLLGAWALAGDLESEGDPEPGARIKFWGLKHWVVTESDPDTGEVTLHHGGTYTLSGSQYTETILFAGESTKELIGLNLQFSIKVKGDTYLQTGVGNPFNERWVRQKDN